MHTDTKGRLEVSVKLHTTYSYIKFWNGMFDMTTRELRTLASLIDSKGELCSKENRTAGAMSLGISIGVMNTYIKRIKDKKALNKNENGYVLSKLLERNTSVEIRIHGAPERN